MTITPQEFVSKWKRVTSREKQSYQEHFIDLCRLVGHQTPNDYDPSGTRFGFEMGAAKTSGGQGWADVAKLGYFGWEYKGKDADLNKAYEQLLHYRDALQNPPLLIVSDINHIVIRTNYTNLPTRTIDLTLDDLLDPESVRILKTVFNHPDQLKPKETVESVTREAAGHFAKLAENLRKYGHAPQDIAHFLIRLLFCLFAEDIGLLPEKLFPQLLEQTRRNSKDFSEVLRQLFHAMNTGGYFGRDKILHFNGGLFDSDTVLPLDTADMDIIADIDALDWGAIQPSIFGTLFERGLDPAKRSQLGAHYTGEDDILLIVEPVLMKPLRVEWESVKEEVRSKKGERKRKKDLQKKIGERLIAFADKVAAVKVLDPACGSGNFLYVALRLLLDLQNEVIAFSDEMGVGRFFPSVSPAQLYGIETNEYAHELAQITIYIGYIQWLVNNGYGFPAEPILKRMENIARMDAILSPSPSALASRGTSPNFDGTSVEIGGGREGAGVEPQWVEADVIVGNPPFLGSQKMRTELGDKYVEDVRALYEGRIPGASDLVCYWFEKARAMIEEGKVKRAGLLATQSIRMGANRKVLDRIKESGNIFWAQSDREWILDGAAVRVSMVGFDDGTISNYILDGKITNSINADLSFSSDLTQAKALHENKNICFRSDEKGGPFDIDEITAKKMLATPNPNGRPNSDVVRPYYNARDITDKWSRSWVIDFGSDMPLEQAALYENPFEHVKRVVKPIRDNSRNQLERDYWWLHRRPAPDMRQAVKGLRRFIGTPRVAKHRMFVWLEQLIIPDSRVYVFAREDDYFLGVLHSRIHETWALATSSRHGVGNDPTYNITTCFETFPFPYPPGQEPKDDPRMVAIGQAAKELVEQRERWLNPESQVTVTLKVTVTSGEAEKKKRTLTNLYNQHPTWLELAHKRLDEAVFAAYGWESTLTDEEILERLLQLNLERSGK